MLQVNAGHRFSNLPPQISMVAVEVDESFVAQELSPRIRNVASRTAQVLVRRQRKDLLTTNVTLLQIRNVPVYNELNFLIHPVLQHLLNVTKIILRQLHDGLPEVAPLPVPVGDKIVRFVLFPAVKILVVLHPVLTKLYLGSLCKCGRAKRTKKKKGVKVETHAGPCWRGGNVQNKYWVPFVGRDNGLMWLRLCG